MAWLLRRRVFSATPYGIAGVSAWVLSSFISINRLSAKGTDEVMKPVADGLPFFIFICYTHLAGCWHTTEPGEVSGGAV